MKSEHSRQKDDPPFNLRGGSAILRNVANSQSRKTMRIRIDQDFEMEAVFDFNPDGPAWLIRQDKQPEI